MNDMLSVTAPKSDQINADDLIGRDMQITITKVEIKGGQDQPVSISFHGSQKFFRPCKSMCRVLVAGWGADANLYIGRTLVLYRDPNVKWGGMPVGGIRIRAMSHIQSDINLVLTESKASRKPHRISKLDIQSVGVQKDNFGTNSASQGEKDAFEIARAEARKGKASFVQWYNSPSGKDLRADYQIKNILSELQSIAAQADAGAAKLESDDPFAAAGPEITAEQMAAAEAEARAALQARDAELTRDYGGQE